MVAICACITLLSILFEIVLQQAIDHVHELRPGVACILRVELLPGNRQVAGIPA